MLRAWTSEDGRLERLTREHDGRIHARRVYPSQTGFERRLYDFGDEQFISGLEGAYFSPVDNLAARARFKLLTDHGGQWCSELRSGWTRFLISLLHRGPESISIFREGVRRLLEKPSQEIQTKYEMVRAEDDPEHYLDYLMSSDKNYFDNTAQRILPGLIDNANLGNFINKMSWAVIDVGRSFHDLLLSDYPLVMSNGIKNPDGHLALAIAPRKLFFASYERSLVDRVLKQGVDTFENYNRIVVERASTFVAAVDRTQDRFIRNRFGKKPLNYLGSVFARAGDGIDGMRSESA